MQQKFLLHRSPLYIKPHHRDVQNTTTSDNVYYVRFGTETVDKPSTRKHKKKTDLAADREELRLELLNLSAQDLQAFKADVRRLGGALGSDVRTVAVDLLVKIVCAQYLGVISRKKISGLCKRAVELRRAGRAARTWVYLRGAVEKILMGTPYTLGEIKPNAEVSEESRQWIACDNMKQDGRPTPALAEEREVVVVNGMNFV